VRPVDILKSNEVYAHTSDAWYTGMRKISRY